MADYAKSSHNDDSTEEKKEKFMSSGVNVQPSVFGGGYGGGYGFGGIAEIAALGLIFGRRGFGGGDDGGHGGCENARFLALENGQSQIIDTMNNNAVQAHIGKFESVVDNHFDRTTGTLGDLKKEISDNRWIAALNTKDIESKIYESSVRAEKCCCEEKELIMCSTQKVIDAICAQTLSFKDEKIDKLTLEVSQLKQNQVLEHFMHKQEKDTIQNNVNFGTQITQLTSAVNSILARG